MDEGSVDGVDGMLPGGVVADEDGGDGVGTRTVAECRCCWIEDDACDGKDAADREDVDDDRAEACVDEDMVDVLGGTLVVVGSWIVTERRCRCRCLCLCLCLCWVEAAEDDELADSTFSHIKQCGRFRCR